MGVRTFNDDSWKDATDLGTRFADYPAVITRQPSAKEEQATGAIFKQHWGAMPSNCWIRGKLVADQGFKPEERKKLGVKATRMENVICRRSGGSQVIVKSAKAINLFLNCKHFLFIIEAYQ